MTTVGNRGYSWKYAVENTLHCTYCCRRVMALRRWRAKLLKSEYCSWQTQLYTDGTTDYKSYSWPKATRCSLLTPSPLWGYLVIICNVFSLNKNFPKEKEPFYHFNTWMLKLNMLHVSYSISSHYITGWTRLHSTIYSKTVPNSLISQIFEGLICCKYCLRFTG